MTIWTEWDPLEEVVVGDCYSPGDLDWCIPPAHVEEFNTILAETKTDLDALATLLTGLGVKVHRPTVYRYSNTVVLDKFAIQAPISPMVPRDQYLVYGDVIYQTYTSMTDRYFDGLSYYDIFKNMFAQGNNWISQPPPMLNDLHKNFEWCSLDPSKNKGHLVYEKLYRQKLLWHTATMFKCGDKLITNTRGPGSQLGLQWMEKNLPVNTIVGSNNVLENWGHIDHGFFMTDDDTVFCIGRHFVPECLSNKNIYDISPYIDPSKLNVNTHMLSALLEDSKGYDQIVSFYGNVLVVDNHNIVMNEANDTLIDFFASKQITCHISPFRHTGFWFGNIHCLTLDIKRRGEKRKIINEI